MENEAWRNLDWGYVCRQAPLIEQSFFEAFGVLSFENYIRDYIEIDHLYDKAQQWWDSLSREDQVRLLQERRSYLLTKIESLDIILECYKHLKTGSCLTQ